MISENKNYKYISLFLGILLLLQMSCMADVRIIDAQGLTRALKKVETPVNLLVMLKNTSLSPSITPQLTLHHVDGILGDIHGVYGPGGRVVFSNVASGTWKIEASDTSLSITEVRFER